MIVAIPHPTQQLVLATEQKKILRQLNSAIPQQAATNESSYSSILCVPEFPLWVKFPDDSDKRKIENIFSSDFFKNKNEKLKPLRKKLNPLAVFNWQEKDGKLFFPVETAFDGEEIRGEITFGKIIDNARHTTEQLSIRNSNLSIIINCKIFRVAQAQFETPEDGASCWRVIDSAWIKI